MIVKLPSFRQAQYVRFLTSVLGVKGPAECTKSAYDAFLKKYIPIYKQLSSKHDRIIEKGKN